MSAPTNRIANSLFKTALFTGLLLMAAPQSHLAAQGAIPLFNIPAQQDEAEKSKSKKCFWNMLSLSMAIGLNSTERGQALGVKGVGYGLLGFLFLNKPMVGLCEKVTGARKDSEKNGKVAATTATEAKSDSVARRAALAFAELDSSIAARLPEVTAPRTALVNPRAIAVVIGNKDYVRSEVPDVEYAQNDAEAMRAFLVRTFGFRPDNVIFELNATYVTLQRLFGNQEDYKGRLFNLLAQDATSDVFVFYSGHGAPDLGTGAPYIVPVDADPQSLRLTAYPLRQLYRNLAQLPTRSVTVVIDACFSGLSDKGVLLRGASPIGLRVDNPILAKENSVVFSASASNEVSGWLDQRQHGLFTYSFLTVLSERYGRGVVSSIPSFVEVGAEVQQRVLSLSRRYRERDQTPQLFGMGASRPLLFANPEP